jgi:hypothetical protein
VSNRTLVEDAVLHAVVPSIFIDGAHNSLGRLILPYGKMALLPLCHASL